MLNSFLTAPVHDQHTKSHSAITSTQLTIIIIWLTTTLLWILRQVHSKSLNHRLRRQIVASAENLPPMTPTEECETEKKVFTGEEITSPINERVAAVDKVSAKCSEINDIIAMTSRSRCSSAIKLPIPDVKQQADCGTVFPTTSPPWAVDDCLEQIVMLGCLMVYFYLCDYIKIFPICQRVYNRDTFAFLVLILFFVGSAFTMKKTADKVLNRDQTEEWKGWMQVLFVWYHYFAAKEVYNWIRVFIACYVWMTGFGNFSFFWIRKDYSLFRVCKMLFRLDFLVIVICAVVSNAYVVYYICGMHTYWFLSVYATMAVYSSHNGNQRVMAVKLGLYALFNAILFELPSVGRVLFSPLTFALGLQRQHLDNNSTVVDDDGDLHEWLFRLGLDHWACLVGMLCAYNYPHWESVIRRIECDKRRLPMFGVQVVNVVKCVVLFIMVGVFIFWYVMFGSEPNKFEYNKHHPYTSSIPIITFVVIRNLWPTLRTHYIGLFAWLGKITLETYLSQLHIYLQSNAVHLITYIDCSRYPLLNFSIATVIYLTVSFRLFHITNSLSSFFLPTDIKLLFKRCGLAMLAVVVSAVVSIILCEQLPAIKSGLSTPVFKSQQL